MTRLSSWLFECKADRKGQRLHHWRRNPDGTATCTRCKLLLSKEEADDCFTDRER